MSNDICTQYKLFKIYIKPVLIRELITKIYGQNSYYKSRKLIIFFFLGYLGWTRGLAIQAGTIYDSTRSIETKDRIHITTEDS